MKKLCQYVVKKAAHKWDFLGYILLDENQPSKIDSIKSDHKNNDKCCVEMFSHWLNTNPNASWYQLVDALNAIELQAVAANLEKMFSTYIY